MKNLSLPMLPVLVLGLLTVPLVAQGPLGPPDIDVVTLPSLLGNKSVIEELKLTNEQRVHLTTSFKEVRPKYRDEIMIAHDNSESDKWEALLRGMHGEMTKVVDSTLTPEQIKRLHQIEIWATLQGAGPAAFSNEKIDQAMKFTDKQKARFKEMWSNLLKVRNNYLKEVLADRDKREEFSTKLRKMATEAIEKFQDSWSDEQKKTWKELTGEKFELKFERPQR
jgi:hypothetical protein